MMTYYYFGFGSNLNADDWIDWCRKRGYSEQESEHGFTFIIARNPSCPPNPGSKAVTGVIVPNIS